MKLICTILVPAAILVSGCDTLHVKQYQVEGVTENSVGAEALKTILNEVANQSGLEDRTSASGMTNLFAYYIGFDNGGVTSINAWFYQDDVRIKLVGGYGTVPSFKRAKHLLESDLSTKFGPRFSTPSKQFSQ